jgi:DNA-binding protein WhiA
MTFASEIKKEICSSKEISPAELYGLLYLKGTFLFRQGSYTINYQTKHSFIASRLVTVFRRLYKKEVSVVLKEQKKLDGQPLYVVIVEKANDILTDLGFELRLGAEQKLSSKYENDITGLFRGLFLAAGSVNSPAAAKYHLEIILENEDDLVYLKKLYLNTLLEEETGQGFKTVVSSKGIVLYLKKLNAISNFLRVLNVNNAFFEFINKTLEKGRNNEANRVLNCDNANIDRSVAAADRQKKLIAAVKHNQAVVLTQTEKDVIKLRLNNEIGSFSELSEESLKVVGRTVSRSTISRAFANIAKKMGIQ